MKGGGIFSSWAKPKPSVMPNNLLEPSDHTKICMYTPKYIKEVDGILEDYKIRPKGLSNIMNLARNLLRNIVITPYLDIIESDYNIDVYKHYTSIKQKMRDIKRLNTLVDKQINEAKNIASEKLNMEEKFQLTERLEKVKKIHCITHMKEEDDLILKPIEFLNTYGGKRKTRNRRSKRKTRKLK